MSPSRLPATLIAITLSAILTEPIGSGRAYAAVLCKSRTGAVVVRGTCKKKESQGDAITVNHKHATETLPGTLDRNVYPEPARRVQLIGERDDSTPNYYKAKIECEVLAERTYGPAAYGELATTLNKITFARDCMRSKGWS